MKFTRPEQIEGESMRIIAEELSQMDVQIEEENMAVVMRAIHTTADFDFAKNMVFSGGAVERAIEALRGGVDIITDTNMARSGINKRRLEAFGCTSHCFMADSDIAEKAKARSTTRAHVSMEKAVSLYPHGIYAIGNAPTALFALEELIKNGARPSLIVAVPVGFVNVVESKERIVALCCENDIPVIAALGRKGGSTVAAAIMNALLLKA